AVEGEVSWPANRHGSSSGVALRGPCRGQVPVPRTPPLRCESVVRGLAGAGQPVFLTAPPGDRTRLFIVQQDGRISIVKRGVLLAAPFLDIGSIVSSLSTGGGNEQGLLSMAFHPGYPADPRFFV